MNEERTEAQNENDEIKKAIAYFTDQIRKYPNQYQEIKSLREVVKAKEVELSYFKQQLKFKVTKLHSLVRPLSPLNKSPDDFGKWILDYDE